MPMKSAAQQMIKAGADTGDGLVDVIEGLVITDKLIASGTDGLQSEIWWTRQKTRYSE